MVSASGTAVPISFKLRIFRVCWGAEHVLSAVLFIPAECIPLLQLGRPSDRVWRSGNWRSFHRLAYCERLVSLAVN